MFLKTEIMLKKQREGRSEGEAECCQAGMKRNGRADLRSLQRIKQGRQYRLSGKLA